MLCGFKTVHKVSAAQAESYHVRFEEQGHMRCTGCLRTLEGFLVGKRTFASILKLEKEALLQIRWTKALSTASCEGELASDAIGPFPPKPITAETSISGPLSKAM